jgi:hypothetical protein
MGYMVFKNGLPVAYAGSWILFDSGRIGLNIFPHYRGGETRYIFEQVLKLHARVYHLKRLTVDPYQIGKDNGDGIHSGAFWVYYHAGFRPLEKKQQELAATEAAKIKSGKKYRSPAASLKILAESRLELIIQKSAVHFDATDMSRAYAGILIKKYNGNRLLAEKDNAEKLSRILQIKNYRDDKMFFILKNWAVLLLSYEAALLNNKHLLKTLKVLFNLKAFGKEEDYITCLQQSPQLKIFAEELLLKYLINQQTLNTG